MSNNEAVITIRKRQYSMSVDGLTEMEIGGIADQVEKKMGEIEKKTNIPILPSWPLWRPWNSPPNFTILSKSPRTSGKPTQGK